jgi:2-polyprenyl-3-methyl-5-hydroxy-6-metoxy-1,4-benzoquinol methylase
MSCRPGDVGSSPSPTERTSIIVAVQLHGIGDAPGAKIMSQDFWDRVYERIDSSQKPNSTILDRAITFLGDVAAKSVLDLGCGSGSSSMYLASKGANVTAIDTSKNAIELLKTSCRQHNIQNINALQMSALDIVELGQFDAVFGLFVLHHIEPFDKFPEILWKAMKPEARAFFYENNGSSRMLLWFRDHALGRLWIPKKGDPDEEPLSPQEVAALRKYFSVTHEFLEMRYFGLIPEYLFGGRFYRPFRMIDRFCLKWGLFVNLSYRQCILLESKCKPS